MNAAVIESPAIRWFGSHLELLDQRHLPHRSEWLTLNSAEGTATAIRDMVVRGAPAIGISAAYGVVLAAAALREKASAETLMPAFEVLAASRPTAVNLFWALQRMRTVALLHNGIDLVDRLRAEAETIHDQDRHMNLQLAGLGVPLIPAGGHIYTHCNTGALATGGHGTALGIIRSAWQAGRIQGVYVGETRPWMQGARLTSWELMQDNIPATLVVDSSAAHLMSQGKIAAVVVGADRITANGDTINKIGTYALAVLARHHQVPFIVAAPHSTIDPALDSGAAVEIEERSADEIRHIQGTLLAPADMPAFNPAFDVTPASLITAIVTEHGVIERPDAARMAAHLRKVSA